MKKQTVDTSSTACSNVGKGQPPCRSLKSCQNIRSPPHSSMGDCLSTLSSGQNCKFKCDPGFESSVFLTVIKENYILVLVKTIYVSVKMEFEQTEINVKHNESVCKSCNPGYYLTDQKQCKPYTGVCLNGFPFPQEQQKIPYVHFKVGYYLEKRHL